MPKETKDEQDELTSKHTSKSKKDEVDNFDQDFEKVETIFPPIYYPESKDAVLIFTLLGIKEGPKGALFTCKLLRSEGGDFKRNDESVDVIKEHFTIEGIEQTGIFALGVTPTLCGEDKLAIKDKTSLTELGQACVDTEEPIKLIYKGKKKSSQNRGFAYHVFELYVTRKARAAAGF